MTFLVKGRKNHQSVVFKRRAMSEMNPSSSSSTSSSNRFFPGDQATQPGFIVEESHIDDKSDEKGFFVYRPSNTPDIMSVETARASRIPDIFTSFPPLRDLLNTETSQVQDETVQECLPFLSGMRVGISYNDFGVPHLDRERHIKFLHKNLRKLPAPYVAADASRPWMFYWALAGLATMGEDISEYRERLIATVRPIQNASGGFGGGNGQMSHLAPTYAIILSLAMVGGREALDLIDRKAMWRWLGALKQPDGGFQLSVGGEEDVR
jgi:protein farnesyltransferase subunit beta